MQDRERCTLEEFQGRWARVQAYLKDEGLAALFAYSQPAEHKWSQIGHVAYLSGFDNYDRLVDTAVVVPVTGRPVVLLAGMPFMLQQMLGPNRIDDIRLVRAVDPNAVAPGGGKDGGPRSFAAETLTVLAENGIDSGGIGVAGLNNMPFPFFEALQQELGDRLKRIPDIIAQHRSVKSENEVRLMRRAAELSDLGFNTMLEVAKPGMSGIEILAEMERAVRLEGADHAMYWMASGPPPDWANAHLDMKPHLRVLEEGDLMASCSYVLYKGYWCHGQRTGAMKREAPELETLCRIAREAQDEGLEVIRPGVPAGRIGQTISRAGLDRGLPIQGGRVGHGMGMDYAESPRLTRDNDELIEDGMTFVVHATFELPDSGAMFVPLGDLCHVTPDGPELLMKFPRTPFVAGQ